MLNKLLEDKKYISTSVWIDVVDYDIISTFIDLLFYEEYCKLWIYIYESSNKIIFYEKY